MSERPRHWPGSCDDVRSYRTRALDRLAVDSVLWEVERHACDVPTERRAVAEPLAIGGERTLPS